MTSTRNLAAAAAAALVVGAGAAAAQDMGASNFYLKGFGGFTLPSSDEAKVRSGNDRTGLTANFNYDTGYTIGAALGYMVTPNVAVELEYAYRNADATGKLTGPGVSIRDTGGDSRANAVMVNALYVFDGMGADGGWQPYVGGGIGGAEVKTFMFEDATASNGNWNSDTLFAYQFIGGVGYEVAPNWTLFGEARYFGTQSGEFDGPGALNFDGEFATVDLLVGARFAF
jgi:opacity protein-like surface antigen